MRDKTWPGFASVVRESDYSNDQIINWFGISEDTLLNWYSTGAPIPTGTTLSFDVETGSSNTVTYY